MTIYLYPEEPCLIPVQFIGEAKNPANPLIPYNKTYTDIEEIYMGLKKDINDDDDTYLAKYLFDNAGGNVESGDVLKDETTHTFTLNKLETDILAIGEYHIYVGIKVAGLTKMLWMRVNKTDTVKVTIDGVKA